MSLSSKSCTQLYSPPPYTDPNSSTATAQASPSRVSNNVSALESTNKVTNKQRINNRQQNNLYHYHHYHHHNHRLCHICGNANSPSDIREIGPYLIHHTQPDLVVICPCPNKAHLICLKNYGTDHICNACNYIYPSKQYITMLAQFLCLVCHLLSLASAIGLVFGLSHLGRTLDELGLGSEIGPKLDGDETWQDHEMAQIVEWLNIVHFATGFAGEALLGLVYIVCVSLVIGLDRTLIMISNILYIQLDPMLKWKQTPKWISKACICVSLFILGLVLGTYLLFFSWIWASVLHHLRRKVLDVKIKKDFNQDHHGNSKVPPPQASLPPSTTIPLTVA